MIYQIRKLGDGYAVLQVSVAFDSADLPFSSS